MVIRTQINPLINALNGLLWLLGISIALILIGFRYLNVAPESALSTTQQSATYAVETTKAVKSLTSVQLKGKDLFVANCNQCHEVADYAVSVGPSLLGVSGRVPSQRWLVDWIKNPSAVVNSGDAYGNEIVKRFAPVVMPAFSTLTETDINAIIDYINSHEPTDGAGAFTM